MGLELVLPALQPLVAVTEQVAGVYKAGFRQNRLGSQIPRGGYGDNPGQTLLAGDRTQPPDQGGGVALSTPVGVRAVAKLYGSLNGLSLEPTSGHGPVTPVDAGWPVPERVCRVGLDQVLQFKQQRRLPEQSLTLIWQGQQRQNIGI